MVRNFKMRKIAIWNWLFALVIMIAIVWTVWETNDYWNLFPLVLPILIVRYATTETSGSVAV